MIRKIFNNELRNVDMSLLILRVAASAFMITHGWGKFLKVLNGDFSFGDPIGLGPALSLILAALAEFICSIMIIVGFKGRFASIFIMITMLVAGLIQHADDGWRRQEFPLLYFFVFLTIFLMGTGKYSIDGRPDEK